MPNIWVSFVKEFADKKKIRYTDALKSQECQDAYKKDKPKFSEDMKVETNHVIDKNPVKIPNIPKTPKTPKSQMKMDMIEPPSKPVEIPISKTEIKSMINRVSKLKPKKDQLEMK